MARIGQSFPSLYRGRGAQWASREGMEELARSSNIQLVHDQGVQMCRTPNGPLLDITGFNVLSITETSSAWEIKTGADNGQAWAFPGVENDTYYLPKTTTTTNFSFFLFRRLNSYGINPTSYWLELSANNPDFTHLGSPHYVNIPTAELPSGSWFLRSPSFLHLADASITSGKMTISYKCNIFTVNAWIAQNSNVHNVPLGWVIDPTAGTSFSFVYQNADDDGETAVLSSSYNSAINDKTLLWNRAANSLNFTASPTSSKSLARVSISSTGKLLYFTPYSSITVPAASAASGSFTYLKSFTLSDPGITITPVNETQTTKRGIIQN